MTNTDDQLFVKTHDTSRFGPGYVVLLYRGKFRVDVDRELLNQPEVLNGLIERAIQNRQKFLDEQ